MDTVVLAQPGAGPLDLDAHFAKVVSEVVPVFWKAGVEGALAAAAARELWEFSGRADLTVDVVRGVFGEFMRTYAVQGRWLVSYGERWSLLTGLNRLLDAVPLPLDVLGSGWRFLEGQWLFPTSMGNLAFPVEMKARVLLEGDWETSRLSLMEDVTGRDAAYPEVAGLPLELAWQVVAAQPVPDEWFVDLFPTPAGGWLPGSAANP